MLLCRIALAFAATAVLAQQNSGTLPDGTVDLNAPILKQHASDARHETGALKEDIVQSLQNSTPYAAQKGLKTTGMSWHINSEPVKPVPGAFLAILKKDTCTAEVIMIGNISDQQSHLTAKRDNVYTDYAFTVQRTLKGRPAKQIVLTRVGGKVDNLPTGGPLTSITIENDQYPSLKLDTTYLVFLDRIAATGAYIAPNPNGTLVANNGQWMIANEAYSKLVVPELAQGALENNIASWLLSCQ